MDVNTVFENQKKAALPDTIEKNYNTRAYSASIIDINFSVSVITAGPTKSVLTSNTSAFGGVKVKTVRNDGRISVTDLKTGKRYPSSDAEYDLTDFNRQIGMAADYNTQAEFDGKLWKLSPIDAANPTLYYSSCEDRIVKVSQVVGDTSTIYTYGYYDESADFPGAVSSVLIERSQYLRDDSYRDYLKSDSLHTTYEIAVTSIKKRSALPSKMFDID